MQALPKEKSLTLQNIRRRKLIREVFVVKSGVTVKHFHTNRKY